MYAVIARRLIMLPVILLFAGFLVFLVPYLSGIDPAEAILRARVEERELTDQTIEQFRQKLGLDRPLAIQYLSWLGQIARGDLGKSYVNQFPIGDIIFPALKVTAQLAIISTGLAFVIAIPLGVMSAVRPGRWLDNAIAIISQTGVAIPGYWLAPVLILIFGLWLGWLPSSGWRGPRFMVLPSLTLSLSGIAMFTRLTRAAVIEVLHMDFIRAARARGLTETQVLWRHAVRNALIPVVTLATLWLAGTLGGAVIIEVIFAIPGIGLILYNAVIASDLPLLQAGLMLITTLAVLINTLTDLIYIILNPAIRLDRPG
jgi:peptide/nickel transport system permease protein